MPDIGTTPDKGEDTRPLGKKIRDLVNAALEDSRRDKIQLDMLDKAFDHVATVLPKHMERAYEALSNRTKSRGGDDPNPLVITALTLADKNDKGDEPYSPANRAKVVIDPNYAQFNAQQIRELPGYKRLHEIARDLDVAVSVSGLLASEEGRGGQPAVTFNAMKGYYEGADSMYPELPPRLVKFDKATARDFEL